MQHGAGVGRRNTGARIPPMQRGPSAPAPLPILNDFEQDPASIRCRFLAFLPGSGLKVEYDVTYSKQTTAPFLPGATTARSHARSSITNALSNRELELLERRLTHRKQTIAPRSNRELSTNLCIANSHFRSVRTRHLLALTQEGPLVTSHRPFLTGSASQTEFAVTHSKQTTAPFLTGSRIVTKRLVSRIVFHRFSSEHFLTLRRISLQDGIAQPRLVAASPRMHALVGRA
jgi:hypothetical protein